VRSDFHKNVGVAIADARLEWYSQEVAASESERRDRDRSEVKQRKALPRSMDIC
jgi:hypothetical protein